MSALALQLIAENKRTKAPFLDLGNCGLIEIPAEIGELVWLKKVSLVNTGEEWDQDLSDLSPLQSLTGLLTLDVSHTNVSDLTPLAGLSALKYLAINGSLVSDLSPLAGLIALTSLAIRDTLVSDLAPLASLRALKNLDVSLTQVSDLFPLRELISLGCPVQWSSQSQNEPGIYVEDCPLTIPPPEIVNQGNEAILNYFREREAGEVDHLYEAKMLIVGEGGAGKTSLLRRLYQPDLPLPTEQETTKGIAIYRHEFPLGNGRKFRLNVWDFGGQEIYHATHQFFLTRRSLYLLVDDTRKDHKSVSDEGFKYWLELIDSFGEHSPVLIYQNEKGGRSKAIDLAGIKGRFDNVKERYAGNLERADATEQLRQAIEFFASHLNHIGDELPKRWIAVRADIEAQADHTPYITQQAYFDTYSRHLPFDRTKALHLSRYLHDVGVFLHFQDDRLLARTVILQNPWATEAVFRILDDETVKAQCGRFTHVDCERLWRDSGYVDMHPELLALMQRFELCYALPDSRHQAWLAPQLLPPSKPTRITGWGRPEDMVLRYRYEFLPKGIISRLTVRMHRFVRDLEMAWTTGVLFKHENSAVLMEVLPRGGEIELRARGPDRKALLSVIAADLDALNESFHGLRDKVDKLIPCNCGVCRSVAEPDYYTQKELLRRKQDRRMTIECRRSYETVDVLELLDGIRLDALPPWAKEEAPTKETRRCKIFLASSSELKEDRDAFDLYIRQQNDRLSTDGIYLEIVRCEKFLDAMSETRSQDEYNKAVRDCDIFVSLFFTKTGDFTEEEFDTAHRQFKEAGRPQIYVYFKHALVPIENISDEINSLLRFKKKLSALEHFPASYETIDDLKLKFREQLDKLLARKTHDTTVV